MLTKNFDNTKQIPGTSAGISISTPFKDRLIKRPLATRLLIGIKDSIVDASSVIEELAIMAFLISLAADLAMFICAIQSYTMPNWLILVGIPGIVLLATLAAYLPYMVLKFIYDHIPKQ